MLKEQSGLLASEVIPYLMLPENGVSFVSLFLHPGYTQGRQLWVTITLPVAGTIFDRIDDNINLSYSVRNTDTSNVVAVVEPHYEMGPIS